MSSHPCHSSAPLWVASAAPPTRQRRSRNRAPAAEAAATRLSAPTAEQLSRLVAPIALFPIARWDLAASPTRTTSGKSVISCSRTALTGSA